MVGAVAEGTLKIAALSDIRRRPAAQIRGPKPVWITALVLVNSVGAVPVAYFLVGRHPAAAGSGWSAGTTATATSDTTAP